MNVIRFHTEARQAKHVCAAVLCRNDRVGVRPGERIQRAYCMFGPPVPRRASRRSTRCYRCRGSYRRHTMLCYHARLMTRRPVTSRTNKDESFARPSVYSASSGSGVGSSLWQINQTGGQAVRPPLSRPSHRSTSGTRTAASIGSSTVALSSTVTKRFRARCVRRSVVTRTAHASSGISWNALHCFIGTPTSCSFCLLRDFNNADALWRAPTALCAVSGVYVRSQLHHRTPAR